MNRLDGLIEYYQVQTLTSQSLTQCVVHTIGHCQLLRICSHLPMLRYLLHKRFESTSSRFVSGDCPLTV
jgi:hypothetical protein